MLSRRRPSRKARMKMPARRILCEIMSVVLLSEKQGMIVPDELFG
jgi:hypothetical protein